MTTLIDKRARLDFSSFKGAEAALAAANAGRRGSRSNASGRHEKLKYHFFDDGWQDLEDLPALATQVTEETARTAITRNQSPDLSFDRSVNPYRGCEHGCSYCYARPTHANMGLSPGLDFETKLFAKPNVAELLRRELLNPNYEPATLALGTNTDPYQPIERRYRITRQILEVLAEFNHPVGIVTKSASIVRDLDILQPMAEKGLVKVALSITTLDAKLARAMEPRASTPTKRLQALEILSKAGVPTAVMVAPVIPALNDHEIESILAAASVAGASEAGYVLLRLPLEVASLFRQWLESAFPDRATHVISLMRSMHGDKDYDPSWGLRQRGTGPYAWSIGRRFEIACKRLKLNKRKLKLSCDLFERPPQPGDQLRLL